MPSIFLNYWDILEIVVRPNFRVNGTAEIMVLIRVKAKNEVGLSLKPSKFNGFELL